MLPMKAILDAPAVTEIAVVRPGELFARVRAGWQRHECPALTLEHLGYLADALAVYNGFSTALPILSVGFPDGERGQIVRPPACVEGTFSLNIRKHSMLVKTLEELTAEGAFANYRDTAHSEAANGGSDAGLPPEDQELLELKCAGDIPAFLDAAVRYRRNIVVSGATAAGKTTFARSLIERVPNDTRIITIEDTHELFLPDHRNRVHMMYVKNPGPGDITAAMCVESAMRMTPERIFLAELRGDETWEYLQALNTGHPGSVTTTHANNARDAYLRLALMIKSSETGRSIDLSTIQTYLLSTIHIVLAFEYYKLKEVYFDPIYARNRLSL
ncbi:P-type DNA transfer ATPase VirB11 [Castellaniella sp. UC4442_H9]